MRGRHFLIQGVDHRQAFFCTAKRFFATTAKRFFAPPNVFLQQPPGLKSADRHFTREPTIAAGRRRCPLTLGHERVVEEVSRESVGCRRHDMVAETWLRTSPTRNGRCVEARNASRNMAARKSQAKSSLSGDIRSHRKVCVEEVLGGIATFRWHGEVSDRPGERSEHFSEGVLNRIRVSDAGPIRPL